MIADSTRKTVPNASSFDASPLTRSTPEHHDSWVQYKLHNGVSGWAMVQLRSQLHHENLTSRACYGVYTSTPCFAKEDGIELVRVDRSTFPRYFVLPRAPEGLPKELIMHPARWRRLTQVTRAYDTKLQALNLQLFRNVLPASELSSALMPPYQG